MTADEFIEKIRSAMARAMARVKAEDPARWERLRREGIEDRVMTLLQARMGR